MFEAIISPADSGSDAPSNRYVNFTLDAKIPCWLAVLLMKEMDCRHYVCKYSSSEIDFKEIKSDYKDLLIRDINECWATRVVRPRNAVDYSLNHALQQRIDAMILILSKATDKSFCDWCKILNIDYDELERLDDEPTKSSASIAMCEAIPTIVGVSRSGKNSLADGIRSAYVEGIERAIASFGTFLSDKNVIDDHEYINCPCMRCELTRQWVELKKTLRSLR